MVIQVKIKSHFFLANYSLIYGGSLLISKYLGTFKISYFDWFLIYFSYGQRTFSEGSVFWNLLISCPRSGLSWPTSLFWLLAQHSVCVGAVGWLTVMLRSSASHWYFAFVCKCWERGITFFPASLPPPVCSTCCQMLVTSPTLYRSSKYQLVHHSQERKSQLIHFCLTLP